MSDIIGNEVISIYSTDEDECLIVDEVRNKAEKPLENVENENVIINIAEDKLQYKLKKRDDNEITVINAINKEKLNELGKRYGDNDNAIVDSSGEMIFDKRGNESKRRKLSSYPSTWTKGMIAYYSAIPENYKNFDQETIREKLGYDPELWWINKADKRRGTINKKHWRCFARCSICRGGGHIKCECKAGKLSCYMCGGDDHYEGSCPNTLCLTCGKKNRGGYVRRCMRCEFEFRNKIKCEICGQRCHREKNCPSKWRVHTTTDSQIKNERKFCYNCASAGHFGFECEEESGSDYAVENPFLTTRRTDYENNNAVGGKDEVIFIENGIDTLTAAGAASLLENKNVAIDICVGKSNYVKINAKRD